MSWANPFALIGLGAIVLPILIHLMARARARQVSVPTLRFLEGTRHQPARRTTLQDIPLLSLRAAALIAVAFAVAGPMRRAEPVPEPDGTVARAVVLDTSPSMQRTAVGAGAAGQSAVAVGNGVADSLAQAATAALIVRTSDPAAALAGAAAWALTRPGRAEVIVVSDFQRGTIEQRDITALPAGVGVAFRKVGVHQGAAPIERRSRQGGVDLVARTEFTGGRTNVIYTVTPRVARASDLEILAARADRATVVAVRAAAAAIGVDDGPDSLAHPVVIAFAGADSSDALVAESTALNEPWQADIAVRVLRDPLLRPGATVSARAIRREGREVLLFVSGAAVATEDGVALIAAVARARSTAVAAPELEPATLADSALADWARDAGARVPQQTESPNSRPTSTRWLWLVALLLLGVEAVLRRSSAFTNRATVAPDLAADDAV